MALEQFEIDGATLVQEPKSGRRAAVPSKWGWNEVISPGTRFAPLPDMVFTNGGTLSKGQLGYETFGTLSPSRDNAILIFTGMSGNAHVTSSARNQKPGWWEEIVGSGRPIDTSDWFVICVNSLGGCKGSTGPASVNPATGNIYGPDFPQVSIEDIADAGAHLLQHLGVSKLACLIGVSMGGMTSLAFLQRHPKIAKTQINISGAVEASAYAISMRSLQREIVRADPAWLDGHYSRDRQPHQSMTLARKLGVLTYRSAQELQERFGRGRASHEGMSERARAASEFEVESYVAHQAEGFAHNFDANSFLILSSAMDRYSLAESAQMPATSALRSVGLERALVLGSSTDILFPPAQQNELAEIFTSAGTKTAYQNLITMKGHDAFLASNSQFAEPIAAFCQDLSDTLNRPEIKSFS